MGLRNTHKTKIGPLTVNYNKKFMPTSATIRLAGMTYRLWGKTKSRGLASVDLPGPWSWRPKQKNRNR